MGDTQHGTLKLLKPEYIESMLQRYNMSNCNLVATPIDKGSHLKD